MKRYAVLMLFVVFILFFNSSSHAVPAYYTFEGTVTGIQYGDGRFNPGDSVKYVLKLDNEASVHQILSNETLSQPPFFYKRHYSYKDTFDVEYVNGDLVFDTLPQNPSHPLPNSIPGFGNQTSAEYFYNYYRYDYWSYIGGDHYFNSQFDTNIDIKQGTGYLNINASGSSNYTAYQGNYRHPSTWVIGDTFTGTQRYYWLQWVEPYSTSFHCFPYLEDCQDFIDNASSYDFISANPYYNSYYLITYSSGNKWETVLAELTLDLTLTDISDTNPLGSQNTSSGNNSAPVPEPSTLLLLASGIAGISFLKRRK